MRRLRILFDAQAFDLQTHGGVSRCFYELYRHLHDVDARIAIRETDNVYLHDLGCNRKGTLYHHFLPMRDCGLKWFLYKLTYNIKAGQWGKLTCRPRINETNLIKEMSKEDFDVFHPTFFDPYFLDTLKRTGKPFVLTVHDMIAELYPQHYDPKAKHLSDKRLLIEKADHIVAVSQQTKRDLIRLMGVDEQRISVIYHGADETPYQPTPGFTMGYDYILFVGARSLYKNFAGFVQGVLPLLKEQTNLHVVCTGVPFNAEEEEMLTATGLRDRFVQLFAKDDQHLSDLYHHALCFVYPSEYEGFGIPILEAWRADCPIILNDIPVFREVAGEAATYAHITADGGNLAQQLTTLCQQSPDEREALLRTQRERLRDFSWTKAAQQLETIYKQLT